jgi:predicted XRE-type DNA-binding protein
MKARTFTNAWDALEDSPEEAAVMTMRSNAMSTITDTVRGWNTTQARAARRLGITQPRLNDLMHGKIDKFSLDTLLTLATRAGLRVKVDVRAAGRLHSQRSSVGLEAPALTMRSASSRCAGSMWSSQVVRVS